MLDMKGLSFHVFHYIRKKEVEKWDICQTQEDKVIIWLQISIHLFLPLSGSRD